MIFKGLRLPKRCLRDRLKIKLSFRIVFNLFDSDKLEIQVVDEHPDLLVYLRGEVLRTCAYTMIVAWFMALLTHILCSL